MMKKQEKQKIHFYDFNQNNLKGKNQKLRKNAKAIRK